MIKNTKLIEYISEMLITIQEASQQLLDFIKNKENDNFNMVANDLLFAIYRIRDVSKPFKEENKNIKLTDTCQCAYDSLLRIINYYKTDINKAENKTEFELIPILEVAYIQFRYWGCAYPDKDKIEQFRQNELKKYTINKYVDKSEKSGKYKYELSILVVAYNKLEYTKRCVESILQTVPKDLNYELILYNHGSSDGTKKYFESINPTKQIDISINGAVADLLYKMYEGKYILGISNDVIVGEYAIKNMLKLIKSDNKAAWIVPSTSNVSNLQSISTNYNNIAELNQFVKINNIYNKKMHEQRTRLCDPISLYKSDLDSKARKNLYMNFFCNDNTNSFPDDKMGLWYRRNGYKLILAKDAYCHHYGSVTLKDEIAEHNAEKFYIDGRKAFLKEYGIDPWGIGFCYDPYLFNILPCNDLGKINILGINCGLGSNPLKIKEKIKEITGNTDSKIYNMINDKRYFLDLSGVSDEVTIFEEITDIIKKIDELSPNYVIIEEGLTEIKYAVNVIKSIMEKVCNNCICCFKCAQAEKIFKLLEQYTNIKITNDWLVIKK